MWKSEFFVNCCASATLSLLIFKSVLAIDYTPILLQQTKADYFNLFESLDE